MHLILAKDNLGGTALKMSRLAKVKSELRSLKKV